MNTTPHPIAIALIAAFSGGLNARIFGIDNRAPGRKRAQDLARLLMARIGQEGADDPGYVEVRSSPGPMSLDPYPSVSRGTVRVTLDGVEHYFTLERAAANAPPFVVQPDQLAKALGGESFDGPDGKSRLRLKAKKEIEVYCGPSDDELLKLDSRQADAKRKERASNRIVAAAIGLQFFEGKAVRITEEEAAVAAKLLETDFTAEDDIHGTAEDDPYLRLENAIREAPLVIQLAPQMSEPPRG
jgi:hypothetical protein